MGDILKIIGRTPIVLEDVFDALVSSAIALCDAEICVFMLYDEKHGYRAVRTRGVTSSFTDWLEQKGAFKPEPTTGLGTVARTKKQVHVEDAAAGTSYSGGDALRVAAVDLGGVRTFMAIPLLSGEELKGAFTIYRTTVRPFDDDHIELVEQFANQAVIALENARLMTETQELSQTLSEINKNLEERVKQQVEELEKHSQLTRFLPDRIAETILSSGDDSILTSHRRMIATIFCDLRRFTGFSESAEPEEVMQILESFHAETTKETAEAGGTIILRAGDGVMIVLNDPIPVDNPADLAIKLASKLRTTLSALCEEWQKYEYDLGFGIGVSYGYATLGVVGTENNQNYTAIGTAVNVASRLCDRASDGQVLVTQRICTEVGKAFEFEFIGKVELKGVSRSMNVFELL